MAKFDEREGNSCHIHLSLRATDGSPVFADAAGRHRMSPLFEHAIAGVLASMREFTLLFAPNINSYKRFARGSFAPTAVAWGIDNRTCAVRVVGDGASMRMELRVLGGDVNPYLAVAGMIASSLDGIDRELPLGDPLAGSARMNIEVMPAVITVIRSTPAVRVLSPGPTVVTIWSVNHSALPNVA